MPTINSNDTCPIALVVRCPGAPLLRALFMPHHITPRQFLIHATSYDLQAILRATHHMTPVLALDVTVSLLPAIVPTLAGHMFTCYHVHSHTGAPCAACNHRSAVAPSSWSKPLQLDDLTEGQKVPGVVKRVESFGVFVTLQNSSVTGMVHISECSDVFVSGPELSPYVVCLVLHPVFTTWSPLLYCATLGVDGSCVGNNNSPNGTTSPLWYQLYLPSLPSPPPYPPFPPSFLQFFRAGG